MNDKDQPKKKAPRISDEQRSEIVEFFENNKKNYELTKQTYEKKFGKEYNIKKEKIDSWVRIHYESKDKLKVKSMLLIYIFEVLRKHSNKGCPLSAQRIKDKINELDIFQNDKISEDDRKIVPRYVRTLKQHFKDAIIEIPAKGSKGNSWYFDPTNAPLFVSGSFSSDEVSLLIDMLRDSKIISSEGTSALIQKLAKSIGDVERKELRVGTNQRGAYKNENQPWLEIKKTVDEAISNYKQVNITYEKDKKQKELTVMPVEIVETDGRYYLRAYLGGKRCRFYLENIKSITIGKEPTSIVGDDNYDLEDESAKLNKTIALDALLSNTRIINHAIKHNEYLTFTYLSFHLEKDNKIKLMPSAPQTVIPINTAYKDGKSYLIAIDPQNGHSPVFYRIDLIKDIKSEGSVEEYEMFDMKDSNEYTDKHPFMLSGFTKIRARFLIKENSFDRVIDVFGLNVKVLYNKKAVELFDGESGKLARAFPELDLDLGFDNDDTLVAVEVNTTDEEAIRFALQNGDVVELLNPELRDRVLHIAEEMEKRHTRSECDRERKAYQNVMSGKEFLKLTSSNETDKKVRSRIEKEKSYDKVTKLHIGYSQEPIPIDDLKNYTNVQELVIEGTGITDFSWIKNTSLRRLTLIHTAIENGDVLAGIPQLDLLFLNRNRLLENYEFLKSMKVGSLFIGRNGKADTCALYDVKYVNNLVIEENLLFDLDVERLENIRIEVDGRRRPMRVSRWIDEFRYFEKPRIYNINPRLFNRQ